MHDFYSKDLSSYGIADYRLCFKEGYQEPTDCVTIVLLLNVFPQTTLPGHSISWTTFCFNLVTSHIHFIIIFLSLYNVTKFIFIQS